ncbi:MAG: hypothetical protein HC805_06545, partial [Alkalinema sp. RL_2_19]|nr:hypothetical protein [Alkalinema sp. RL_2_19]
MKSWQTGLVAAPAILGAVLVTSTASASEVLFPASAVKDDRAMSSITSVS